MIYRGSRRIIWRKFIGRKALRAEPEKVLESKSNYGIHWIMAFISMCRVYMEFWTKSWGSKDLDTLMHSKQINPLFFSYLCSLHLVTCSYKCTLKRTNKPRSSMDALNYLCTWLKWMPLGDFLWYHVDTVSISKVKNSLGKRGGLCAFMTGKLS